MNLQEGTDIGMGDKKGRAFKLGDYVCRDCGEYSDIKGQIVFGFHSCGHDEWGLEYKTIGFFIKYKDESGTTGLTPEWEVITKEEYEED